MQDIYLDIVTDETIRVSGIQTGDYDIALSIPYDNAAQLESDPSIRTFAEPYGFQGIRFNKKEGTFSDNQARKAVNAALDMDAIATAALDVMGTPYQVKTMSLLLPLH